MPAARGVSLPHLRTSRPVALRLAWVAALVSHAAVALAQPPAPPSASGKQPSASSAPPPEPPQPAPPSPGLEEAKELFRQGTALLQAGDYARALEFYLKSRARVPSVPNTLNAAICLDRLERHDEALELYEDLITSFHDELTDDTKQSVAAAMAALRRKVGAVDVAANVDGTLVIDSRMRGTLPLISPVRVLPGEHSVRVFKDGYESFEKTISVRVGDTVVVEARLRPLASAGRLRVDDRRLEGAELFVDGAGVGKVPWEGTLAPGPHVVQVISGERGSGLVLANVLQGQVATTALELHALAADLRIMSEPASADIFIDDVRVAAGRWQGRLPVGKHAIRAQEEGYRTQIVSLSASPGNGSRLSLRLQVDPDHPKWNRVRGAVWLQAFGGAGLAKGMGGAAQDACGAGHCTSDGLAFGPVAGLRGGYEFPFHGSVELAAGVIALRQKVSRTLESGFDTNPYSAGDTVRHVSIAYALRDTLRFAGPFVAGGASYRAPLGASLTLTGRVDVGVLFVSSSDSVAGTASAGGVTLDAGIDGSGKATRSAAVFGWPEVALDYDVGKWSIGAGLGVGVFLADGPRGKLGDALVSNEGCVKDPSSPAYDPATAACAPRSSVVAGESPYGRFLLWMPVVSVRREFR